MAGGDVTAKTAIVALLFSNRLMVASSLPRRHAVSTANAADAASAPRPS